MSDIYEAFESAAHEQGAAVGTRLRADEAKAAMAGAALRGRQRRRRTQSIVATLAVALVGAGLAWVLPQALDQQPAVIDEDVPRIVPGAFECGEVPRDLPEPGIYTTTPDEAPELLSWALFSRWVDEGGVEQVRVLDPVPGGGETGEVDARAALGFAVAVGWGEDGVVPSRWGITTAAATLDSARAVVAVHDGLTVRGDVLDVVEQRRGEEGLLSFSECGEEAPRGDHTVATIVQVWADEESSIVATYVLASTVLSFGEGDGEVGMTDEDGSRVVAGPEMEALIAIEGERLVDAALGTRAMPGGIASQTNGEMLLCERAEVASDGLDAIDVMPLDPPSLDIAMGMLEMPGGAAPSALGFAFPVDRLEDLWMISTTPTSLLLFDEEGALVSALGGGAQLGSDEDDGGEIAYRFFPDQDGCEVPAVIPDAPGRYSAVYVWSAVDGLPSSIHGVDRSTGASLDYWLVLPDVVVRTDGTIEDLPIQATDGGWVLVG
ncbi:hypothetical protein [Demequina sp. NBRC 110054]|uniref:hypothetical protein n=1 Tax=Demequina sp. NBRC 110054 TaxID=1570343 RepID=UPI000A074629|nr:hypothetical protein [Demequina sp. NBRC 110054]